MLSKALLPGVAAFLLIASFGRCAEESEIRKLPPPDTVGGKPLMQALHERHTIRELDSRELPLQTVANVLWAGFGINRPATDQRTAPSAMNSQEIDIYALTGKGAFIYEAKPHQLRQVVAGDLRAKASGQDSIRQAPLVLVYVATLPRLAKAKPEARPFYAGIDTGCIVQNVYLVCASEDLASVVFDLDRPPLFKALELKPEQQIILAQAVGYPKTNRPPSAP